MDQATAGTAGIAAGLSGGKLRGLWRLRKALANRRFAVDLLLGAGLMIVVHMFVVQISVVKGHSMEPSLWDGDRLVVDRVFSDLQSGQVVVLRYPRNPRVDFVKRIVGVAGDRVYLRQGHLYVNGEMVDSEWTCIEDLDSTVEVTVPDGHYFVLGDNRAVSCDSREFGLVAEELVKGRVCVRFWPLDRLMLF